MIEVYVKGNEDYGSNGDMTLTPTTCEVELTVEGVAELTLEHSIDDLGRWEYLVTDNVIAAPTPYSKKQLFRIYDYTKTETEVTAYARHDLNRVEYRAGLRIKGDTMARIRVNTEQTNGN